MNRWIPLIVVATMYGCATPEPRHAQTRPVPESQLFSRQWLHASARTVPLTLVLEISRMPRFCGSRLALDGTEVATLAAGEQIDLHVSFGDHVLTTRAAPLQAIAICPGGLTQMIVRMEPGKAQRYRLARNADGDMYFLPADLQR